MKGCMYLNLSSKCSVDEHQRLLILAMNGVMWAPCWASEMTFNVIAIIVDADLPDGEQATARSQLAK